MRGTVTRQVGSCAGQRNGEADGIGRDSCELEGRYRENRDLQEELVSLRCTYEQCVRNCKRRRAVRSVDRKLDIDALHARIHRLQKQVDEVVLVGSDYFGTKFTSIDGLIAHIRRCKSEYEKSAETARRKYRKWKSRARELEKCPMTSEQQESTPASTRADITRLETEMGLARDRMQEFEERWKSEKAMWMERLQAAQQCAHQAKEAAHEAERDAACTEAEVVRMRAHVAQLTRDTERLREKCQAARLAQCGVGGDATKDGCDASAGREECAQMAASS